MTATPPTLLNDEQVQQFIVDGFLVLDSQLPRILHESISQNLHHSLKNESSWLGDNLLPRLPQLQQVLSGPVVMGAMQSLLGKEFAWAPHRFPHNSEPLEDVNSDGEFDPFTNGPAMGKGSISGSGWHQDGHSKAGRSRWHTCKAINMFYFPHDVPLEMGPTRLLAGSQLFASLRSAKPSQVFYEPLREGTVVIADFDLGHAGTPNLTSTSRYMLKFVALRTANPSQASWQNTSGEWKTPESKLYEDSLPVTWATLWRWLQGRRSTQQDEVSSTNLQSLIQNLASVDPVTRLESMYGLVQRGNEAIEPLLEKLLSTTGLDRHESPPKNDPGFYAMSEDHLERKFSQRQFVPEDSAIALGLIGEASLEHLTSLLKHDDPWIRINSAYAIGEIGHPVPQEVGDQIGELLVDELHSVVRAAADALCWVPFSESTLGRIRDLFFDEREEWHVNAMGEPGLGGRWTIHNQIRYSLSWALRCRINYPLGKTYEFEQTLLDLLPIESGYTPAVICQTLELVGSQRALKAVVAYLQARRWDAFSFDPKQKVASG